MSLSELYGIGKQTQHAVSVVKSASTSAARKRGPDQNQNRLIEILNDNDDAKVDQISAEIDEDKRRQLEHTSAVNLDASSLQASRMSRPKCLICRKMESKYNCPTCNIPYCSLDCYRARQHVNCSQPFTRKTMQEELGLQGGSVDEKERAAMMDLLRRHQLSDNEQEDVNKEEISYDEEAELADLSNVEEIDLDTASVDQMIKMLTDEERQIFDATINDGSEEKARMLLEKLMHTTGIDSEDGLKGALAQPWWEDDAELVLAPETEKIYKSSVKLSRQLSTSDQKKVDLSFNIITVLLTYVYLIRHLDVHSLQDAVINKDVKEQHKVNNTDEMPPLESVDEVRSDVTQDEYEERKILQGRIVEMSKQLLPFLRADTADSRTVFESAEEASLWFTARLGSDIRSEAAILLVYLLKDVKALVASPLVVEVDTAAKNKVASALCDLAVHLETFSQRKLIFYCAYWLHLESSLLEKIEQQVDTEMQRLQAELDRAEDEARFAAANEAIQQQIVLS